MRALTTSFASLFILAIPARSVCEPAHRGLHAPRRPSRRRRSLDGAQGCFGHGPEACVFLLLDAVFAAFLCVRRSVGLTAHALLRTTHLTGKAVMRIGKPLEHAQAAIKLSAQVPSSV